MLHPSGGCILGLILYLMSKTSPQNDIVHRRGELLSELFLQDLNPEFLARSSANLGYDYLVGFRNTRGGTNNVAVQVMATEQFSGKTYRMDRRKYDRWVNSNLPVLLLVIDVKLNRLFYAWLPAQGSTGAGESPTIGIPLTEVKPEVEEALRQRLAAWPLTPSHLDDRAGAHTGR